MKLSLQALCFLLGLGLAGCSQFGDKETSTRLGEGGEPALGLPADDDDEDEDDDEQEEDVPLDQVPEAAKAAALAEVPGLVLSEAEKETEDGAVHYCLHGTANGVFYEVEVTPDGEVLEVESGEDDDDEDDD